MTVEDDTRRRQMRLLQAAGLAQAANEQLDMTALAAEMEVSPSTIEMEIEQLEAAGLLLSGRGEQPHPMLLGAGRQFLAARGEVQRDILYFLPAVVDDLHAREALIFAGIVVID